MTPDELKTLLRLRAEAMMPRAEVLDRALARCARIGVRQSATSGRLSSSSLPTAPPAVASQPPATGDALAITVHSLAEAPASPTPAGQLPNGRIVAGYRIEGLLGKGGMGSVYRATQLSMNRQVAFKVLAPRFATDPTFVGRFRREARAAGRLQHHNLVMVHDSGEADGLVFFSMELVEGQSLKDVLKQRGRLPPDEALAMGRQVLEALAYAHSRNVVHRDIKPDNLMITATGTIKVADLGLSRIDDVGANESNMFETSAGSFMGTPHYMAPEQGRDAHKADHRCDLYALGATLYHLICGRQPFNGTTPMEVMIAAQQQPLTWIEPAPPQAVRELIARLMEKDPNRRPADAAAAIALVDRVVQPRGVALHHMPAARGRRWRTVVLTVLAMLVASGLVLAALRVARERHLDQQWNNLLVDAEAEADRQAYAAAIARLQRARDKMRDGTERAAACDQAIAACVASWNAWSQPNIDAIERKFRELIAGGRYADALAKLREPPESWRSPETESRLEAMQRMWEEAVARDAERKPQAGSPGLLEDFRKHREKSFVDLFRRATIEPANAITMGEGTATCSASGRAVLQLSGGLGLRLTWSGTGGPAARWELVLAPEVTVVLRSDSAELHERGVVRALQRAADGSVLIVLAKRGAGTMPRPGGDGVEVLPMPAGPVTLRWRLDGANVVISPVVRR